MVFGERNRGNVYNLLKQINSGLFVMIGSGNNIKSMAYVENVASFILYMIKEASGYQIFNYVDKPDYTMNEFVGYVQECLGKKSLIGLHIPYIIGYMIGLAFDILSLITNKKFQISSLRVKKFCATTQFDTTLYEKTNFKPPVPLQDGIRNTIIYEFIKNNKDDNILFFSE